MRQIGSQIRDILEESHMALTILLIEEHEAILTDKDGLSELWAQNNDYSGYVIEINGVGYEFIREVTPQDIASYQLSNS